LGRALEAVSWCDRKADVGRDRRLVLSDQPHLGLQDVEHRQRSGQVEQDHVGMYQHADEGAARRRLLCLCLGAKQPGERGRAERGVEFPAVHDSLLVLARASDAHIFILPWSIGMLPWSIVPPGEVAESSGPRAPNPRTLNVIAFFPAFSKSSVTVMVSPCFSGRAMSVSIRW